MRSRIGPGGAVRIPVWAPLLEPPPGYGPMFHRTIGYSIVNHDRHF